MRENAWFALAKRRIFRSDREKFRISQRRVFDPPCHFNIASRVALNSLPGFQSGNFEAFATL